MHRLKRPLRWLLGVAMCAVGVTHFVIPGAFAAMVPSALPAPLLLVYISGVGEIAGGVGLQLARTRRLAAWGLILLYIAVFPANLNMALHPERFAGTPPLALWARLPFQLLFIAWAYWNTRPDGSSAKLP